MNCFLYVYVSLNLVSVQSHCLNVDEYCDIALLNIIMNSFLIGLGLTVYKRTLLIIFQND